MYIYTDINFSTYVCSSIVIAVHNLRFEVLHMLLVMC